MNMLLEYIGQSYITLLSLAGLIVILLANQRTRIESVNLVWVMIGLVFLLTICSYAENWCYNYNKAVWIRYVKSFISYSVNPLLIMLELYLIAPVRHKLLLSLPYAANTIIAVIDLTGTNLIYGYTADNIFLPGKLHILPALVICFYILLLTGYSIRLLKNGDPSKAIVVFFLSATTILTVFLEYKCIIIGHTNEVAALDMLIYYFYLAAIQHNKVQKKLHESELMLEQQKNELLMAQIQPHFINNSLLAIQARCMEYPDIYESLRSFSHYLRSNFDNLGSSNMITFGQELKNIKAYLALEKLNFGDKLHIEYDIEGTDFLLPALTVEPLVENAVRHGVAAREKGGTVQIIQRDEENGITIEVRDIGSGSLNLTEKQEKRRGIGINNVKARLGSGDKGVLEMFQEPDGMCARITLKGVIYEMEERSRLK